MKRTEYRLADIVSRFGGRAVGEAGISQIATLDKAGSGDIVFLASIKYRAQLDATRASAVIVGEADADATALPRIICNNPYLYFARVSALLNPPPSFAPGIHASATVGAGAQIAPDACIGPHVSIGANAVIGARCVVMDGCSIGDNATLGEDSRLYPRVTVYHDCVLGKRLIAHSGVVIGADGFGMAPDENGHWLKIPQIGRVVIGDDVEIGANTTIDRGALDDTVIEEGVKLDNLIQVAHNVRIGAHTVIAGCVGIAGSAVIGKHCRIGGGVGIAGHLQIADNVVVAGFSLVSGSLTKAGSYAGAFPSSTDDKWRRNAVHVRNLDALAGKIKILQQEMEQLRSEQP
ncbi:MAG: UDP-3-O-(3-hydroxymyristoyl)glucosamine N-acyltransferase [Gallionellaceae bacterium]|jgi:UDP-3-O-[3-hydroxymyristoyl] glucosamine N-acyltransferase|nr:UDP-3-O-(3-hydroxymyristoyl)glucosamine N-acyltransferase [Gallionellaceae bacterium]